MKSTQTRTFRPQLENLEDRSVPTTLAATFGTAGLFRFTDDRGWQQLTPFVPQSFAIAQDGTVAASFNVAGQGTYRFTNNFGWQQISTFTADQVGIDNRDRVFASFNGAGLFRFNNQGQAPQMLLGFAPTQFKVSPDGDVAASFTGIGLFSMRDGQSWRFLAPFAPTDFAVGDNGYVAGNFEGIGLYRFHNGDFQQLSPFPVAMDDLSINGSGDVAADFTNVGVFVWQGGDSTDYDRVLQFDPQQLGYSNGDRLVGNFAGAGIFEFNDGVRQLLPFAATRIMVAEDS